MKWLAILTFFFTSCTTYYIPTDSFKDQFSQINKDSLTDISIQTPFSYIANAKINNLDSIRCLDKNGNIKMLAKSPSLEVRFTEKNGKRTVLYFDQIYMQDTLIIGNQSRFLGGTKSISINNIEKIEIQNGHKNFNYSK